MNAARYNKALEIGRPENIKKLFPNSNALIVSGKTMNEIIKAKGDTTLIAANGRNEAVLRGSLLAAQAAGSAVIIEIAKSEGGIESSYCPYNYLDLAKKVDQLANELNIRVPIAIHADHYGIKSQADIDKAMIEIPQMIEAGVTSIAIDASHMPDHLNLLANIALQKVLPSWAGYETEIGEIVGKKGLNTLVDAIFLIAGLNAHGIFPDWLAINNGTTHGVEKSDAGIQVELTGEIHEGIKEYDVVGAQHGTSGNNNDRLTAIRQKTRTTKANLATALQMISWGVKVNEFGNAEQANTTNIAKADLEKMFEKHEATVKLDSFWSQLSALGEDTGINGMYKIDIIANKEKVSAITKGLEISEKLDKEIQAILDKYRDFVKEDTKGVTTELWNKMMKHALEKKWRGGDIKKLNKPFETDMLAQSQEIKDRMVQDVRDFMIPLMTNVFNSAGTAKLVVDGILKNSSAEVKRDVKIIANPEEWGVNITDPKEKEEFLRLKSIQMGVSAALKTGKSE
ncbi:MAG: class II fructose-bisphosphate aldolase [Candidatus Margulisbacteria bacterium]|nr:class II fructose-bisphosphate aldolase [Candidatus Margulisiibacteriota bacterium]